MSCQTHSIRYSVSWFKDTNFNKYLSHLKNKENQFLEIGSFEGKSTNYFLDTFLSHNDSRITCIDPWIKYSESTLTSMKNWDNLINEDTYDIFINNTRGNADKLIIKKGLSKDILPSLPDNCYDFVYIDGDHSEDAVWVDAVLSFPKLKDNGIMVFDDYDWNKGKRNPKLAIDRFIKEYKDKIRVLGFPPDTRNQVVIQKIK